MFDSGQRDSPIDDTLPLSVDIANTVHKESFVLYELRVWRGVASDASWVVTHRYSDFAGLNSQFQGWGYGELPFPKKKLFGNMDRNFIEERRKALQVYIEVVLQHPLLSGSLPLKSFLDPERYCNTFPEEALRQTSMLLRTEPHWKLVEPLRGIGYRLRKTHFLVNCETEVVSRQILSWAETGTYFSMTSKEMGSLCKLLTTVQHPHITPVTLAVFNQTGLHIARPFHTAGSLRDFMSGAKPKNVFFKKYCNSKSVLREEEIAVVGRHVLEALVFLADRGMPYGHLHAGNVMVDTTSKGNIYKLSELENFILGLPSAHRNLHVQHGAVKTTQDADIYNMGILLHEMATGIVPGTPTTDMLPATVPPAIRKIIESILSSPAQKDGFPTLDDLIADIFFAPTAGNNHVTPVLKLSNRNKQSIVNSATLFETALGNDQKAVNVTRRQTKALQRNHSEEKKRRRKKKSMTEKDRNSVVATSPAPAPSSTVPPPLPPPPPPPPATPSVQPQPTAAPDTIPQGDGKSALLNSIQGFSSGKLKKTVTDDKSIPRI